MFLSFFQAFLGTGLISFDMLYVVYTSMPDDKERFCSSGFFIIMRPYIVGILIFFLTSLTIAQSDSDVKLLQKDGNSITLEFTPHIVQHVKNGFDKKSYTWFSFQYCSVEIDSNSGDLRFIRPIPLLLPSQQYTLTIVKADSRIESVNNFPRAEPLLFRTKRTFRTGMPNNHLVELRDIVQHGNCFIATLVYQPVEKVNEKSTKIYSHIIVRLTFGASLPASMQCLALLNCKTAADVLHSAQLKNTNVNAKNIISKNTITGQSTAPYVSPISQGTWYRLGVTQTGMYKLDYSFFKNNGIASSFWTSIKNIHLYGNGGAPAPENIAASYPQDLQEIKRLVVDKNNNGVFDEGDYIVFYGKAARGWTYNKTLKTFNHYINVYADTNYYFITSTGTEGDSMSVLSSAAVDTVSAARPSSFTGKVFVEDEKQNLIASGREWVGEQFSSNSASVSFTNTLTGFVHGSPVLYRFVFYARSSTNDYLKITENGTPLVNFVSLGAMTSDALADNSVPYALETDISQSLSGAIQNGSSVLNINYTTSNSNALAWLDWIEILYSSSYTTTNDFLLCTSPDTTALVKYSVSNISAGDDFVFDVTDHANVQRVNNFKYTNGVCEFFLPDTAGKVHEFAIAGNSGLKSIQSVASISTTQNLHDQSKTCDMVIITPSDFWAAAMALKTHRETFDTIKTNVVDVQDVFKEFSGGMQDPTGIRNFLCYAYNRWNAKYVLLLGEGHYDYRNITTSARNWIIPYETEESIDQTYSYVSDDYFACLINGDTRMTIALGRIPARSASDASQAVNKIISYETESPQDVWRNCITFVGDDQYATRVIGDTANMIAQYPGDVQWGHCLSTEMLAQSSYTPSTFEKRKILLPEYPDVASASGRHKPEAIAAIINAVNNGTLVLNYIGHCNDQVWSHTEVFTVDGSISSLTNANKLSCFIVAGCSWGLYDNPSSISGGELLMTMAQGGTVLEVSASRVVDETDNVALDDYLFANMLFKDPYGNPPRIGDAMLTVKQAFTDVNSRKYHLFGDPAVRLAMPRMTATIDSINGKNANLPLKVQALGLVQAQGSIKMPNIQKDTSFSGTGYFTIFDAYQYLKFNGFPATDSFKVLGSALYNGTISISNGGYIAKGPIPKDVTYGQNTRISLYAFQNNSKIDAVGYNEILTISGIDTAASADVTGPNVNIYLNDLAFQSGDVVASNASLIVKLTDSSGINTSTSGVGHQMTAYLTNPAETVVLSDFYRGDPNTYKSGTVTYPLSGLTEGSHTLQVKAWDIYNNGSEEQISFMVKSGNETAMSNIFNYPNPFSSSTIFTFQRNSIDPIDVEIKIYTIAGRCIRIIHGAALTNRFVQIPWDGTDAEGAKIANGIYLYKIVTRSLSSNNSNEYIGKIARVH